MEKMFKILYQIFKFPRPIILMTDDSNNNSILLVLHVLRDRGGHMTNM